MGSEMCIRDRASADVSLLYTKKYLRQLLKERYADCTYFASQPGSDDVIGFRNYSKLIVHNKWLDDHNTSGASEAERVVQQSAALILADMTENSNCR